MTKFGRWYSTQGCVGASITRELSRFDLNVLMMYVTQPTRTVVFVFGVHILAV